MNFAGKTLVATVLSLISFSTLGLASETVACPSKTSKDYLEMKDQRLFEELKFLGIGQCTYQMIQQAIPCPDGFCLTTYERWVRILLAGKAHAENTIYVGTTLHEDRNSAIEPRYHADVATRLRYLVSNGFCDKQK